MVEQINKSWGWVGMEAAQVFSVNDFGHCIVKALDDSFWLISPEELKCEVIAADRAALGQLLSDPDFLESWELIELVEAARAALGELDLGEKYCLKLPVPFGGLYDAQNIGKINHKDLIALSGEMAFRTKDLSDDDKLRMILGEI